MSARLLVGRHASVEVEWFEYYVFTNLFIHVAGFMTISAQNLAQFEAQGFLLARGLLDPATDLAPVRAEYASVVDHAARDMVARGLIRSAHPGLSFDERIGILFEQSDGEFNKYLDITLPQKGVTMSTPMHCGPAVFALLRHPKLLDAVEGFIGPEILSNPTQHARVKPPAKRLENNTRVSSEVATTVWHQDQGTVTPESDHTKMLTVWIAVTEATEENGCLLVAPGSHKRGLALHCHDSRANYSRQSIPDHLVGPQRIPVEAKPGDVIFLHKLTMHASLENRSNQVRWSFDLRYNPIGQATGRAWFPSFVARSRLNPKNELADAAQWADQWRKARDRLISNPPASFQRWAKDDPGCA